jgi:hypothetical protein
MYANFEDVIFTDPFRKHSRIKNNLFILDSGFYPLSPN